MWCAGYGRFQGRSFGEVAWRNEDEHRTRRADQRVGDAERDATAMRLGDHFSAGRLTLEEYDARLDDVLVAKTQRDLEETVRDLPRIATYAERRARRGENAGRMLRVALVVAAVVAVLALVGDGVRIWPLFFVMWWLGPMLAHRARRHAAQRSWRAVV